MPSQPNIWRMLPVLPKAKRWIAGVVADHQARARPISSFGFDRLPDYYNPNLLDTAKAIVVEQVPKPPVEQWGLAAMGGFDVVDAAGITFGDYFFVSQSCGSDESLFFHELVHVVQARTLGLNRFLAMYGLFLVTHGYWDSPLETMAYDLQKQFDQKTKPFEALEVIVERSKQLLGQIRQQSFGWKITLAAANWI